jgi:hypothetical protein
MVSRKLIVLLVIFLGLLAYVYFFEIRGEKQQQAKKDKEELLISLDKSQVKGLSFLPEGIIIEKDSARWKVQAPISDEADGSTIESILDAFSWLKKGRFVADNPGDFKKFGLTPYRYALVIRQSKSSDTLLLGDNNLDNTDVFYRKSGSNQVFLVPTSLKTNVTKSLFDLRDKSVLKFEKAKISKMLIENKGQAYSCFKTKDRQWWLAYPIRTRGDEDKIDNILNELHNSKVKRFESEQTSDLKKYDMARPWLTVTLFDSSARQHSALNVGKKERQEYYANDKSRPSIFLIDSSLVAELNVSLFDLRNKTIVTFEEDSVTELFLQYPDFTFHCIKDSTQKWLITQPDSGLAKSWKIFALFYNIKDLKVAQFIDEPYQSDAFYGFDRPEIKLILKKDNSNLIELLIGKKNEERVYLKNNITNKIYLVKTKVTNDLLVKTEEFLDKDN